MPNYKSASRQLQNSGQLQNNTVNGAMLITVNRVIRRIITLKFQRQIHIPFRETRCLDLFN